MNRSSRHVFEEEDVLDWFHELEDVGGRKSFIDATLSELHRVVESEEYIDRYWAGRGIALGEWLASLRGHKHEAASPYVEDLLRSRRSKLPDEILVQYLPLLRKISKECETKELWEGAGLSLAWLEETNNLLSRLSLPPAKSVKEKAIRFRGGVIFAIGLPNNRVVYGIVLDYLRRYVKVFGADVRIEDIHSEGRDLSGFSILLLQGPLETGVWPIVDKNPSYKSWDIRPVFFRQEGYQFGVLEGIRGRSASVRECQDLESPFYWPPEDVIERVLVGECSERLQEYWPKCLNDDGVLKPMRWKEWTEEDFQRMEGAQKQTAR